MQYSGMPMGMWALYKKSFQSHLVSVLGFNEEEAARVVAAAKPKYKESSQSSRNLKKKTVSN